MLTLRGFQKDFLRGALAPGVDTAALSIPRGNGKTALAGHLVERILTPSDPLFVAGTESVLCAASLKQARKVYNFARQWMEGNKDYSFADSFNSIHIMHRPTRTKVEAIGSNGKTAMGLVNCPWVICDEPGAWEVNGGTLLHDAIEEAKGKPGSPLRSLYVGTIAPSLGGWWADMRADGTRGSQFVLSLQGDLRRWDNMREVYRVNPLMRHFADSRAKLTERRDQARGDSRLKARFLSYRLNVPTADESEMLLTADDWQHVLARPVAVAEGLPVVGIDLGGGRAWSAAVAMWRSGRTEALAITPGIPTIREQERRDRVPAGTYARLIAQGRLMVADGLRVPPPQTLMDAIRRQWGVPAAIFCDWFRLNELRDTSPPCEIITRKMKSKMEAAGDIRSLRRTAKDGPMSVEGESRALVTASLSAAMVKPDGLGNVFLVKRGSNNQARDDVAAALVLAAGAVGKLPAPGPSLRVLVAA